MDSRSLVGMTQSARKRRARMDAASSNPDQRHDRADIENPRVRRQIGRHLLGLFSALHGESDDFGITDRYKADRARYRIGERLRPCRGCVACPQSPRLRPRDKGERFIHPNLCDGSGVLPARKESR